MAGSTDQTQLQIIDLVFKLLEIPYLVSDIACSFVALGGNSSTAIALSSACKKQGISLSTSAILLSKSLNELAQQSAPIRYVEPKLLALYNPVSKDGCRKNSAPDIECVARASLIDYMSKVKAQSCGRRPTASPNLQPTVAARLKRKFPSSDSTFDYLLSNKKIKDRHGNQKPKAGFEYPMTEMQLLFMHGSFKDAQANVIRFSEANPLPTLSRVKLAWQKAILHEPTLHTEFIIKGDGGIARAVPPQFHWNETRTDSRLVYLQKVRERPSSLSQANKVGFEVVVFEDWWSELSEFTVLWYVHHALLDGYSASLIYQNFQRALRDEKLKVHAPFDLVARELRCLQDAEASQTIQFWREYLSRHQDAKSDILLSQPRLSSSSSGGDQIEIISLESPVQDILTVCRATHCTQASFYCAAWALLLSRYCASDHVMFGIACSGRNLPLPDVGEVIGPLVNTLPFCLNLEKLHTVGALLQSAFETMIELTTVQHARAADGFARSFSSVVAMQFDMMPNAASMIKPIRSAVTRVCSDAPLSLQIYESGLVQIAYRPSVFRDGDMSLLADSLQATVLSLLNTQQTIASCLDNFLASSCRDRLLRAGNCGLPSTSPGYCQDTLVSLFNAIADAHPAAVSVRRGSVELSYHDLRDRVIHVASQISPLVQPGDVVCVHADRSLNWICAIYAVLFLGAVYAPFDPSMPMFLRDQNFQASGSRVYLVPSESQRSHKPLSCDNCLSIDELLLHSCLVSTTESIPRKLEPSSAAYVCFTSGSTGRPKGVLCTHEGLVAFQQSYEVRLRAEPGCRVAQLMSPAFDGSIHEIFSALSYGATLVLTSSEYDVLEHLSAATSIVTTPTLLSDLDPSDFPLLKNVYLVGEAVPQFICDAWAASKRLYNMYGPTEATCGTTISRLRPGKQVTIGRPNSSSRIYILDSNLRLLPPGVVGEIFIAGVQVSKGYIGNEEQTREVFMEDIICPSLQDRMYRTGDLGYWDATGEIRCVGRRDRQIKLRGFRLNLNDIESRIVKSIPSIAGVAIAQKGEHLVALCQPSDLDVVVIKQQMQQVLQPHAVPRYIATVESFPKTKVGKLDYAAIASHNFVQPVTLAEKFYSPTEQRLFEICRDVLSLPGCSDTDLATSNFVSLGGHSILQLTFAERCSTEFDSCLGMRDVLSALHTGSLHALACLIDSAGFTPTGLISRSVSRSTLGQTCLSPSESSWFRRYQLDDVTTQLNVSIAWKIDPDVMDTERLLQSWSCVLERHNILYSRYSSGVAGQPLRTLSNSAPRASLSADDDLERGVNKPFDLARESPARVHIYRNHLLFCASHIVCDLTALQRILNEVAQHYQGNKLQPVGREYFDTSYWFEASEPNSLDFWKRKVSSPIQERMGRLSIEKWPSSRGSSKVFDLGQVLLPKMKHLAGQWDLTNHQIALAAVAAALTPTLQNQHPNLLLGGPYLNRSREDAQVVGLFLDPILIALPLAHEMGTTEACRSYLQSVASSSQESLSHVIPWSHVLRELKIMPDAPNHQLYDAMVTFHELQLGPGLDLPGLQPVITWANGTKFRLMSEFTALASGRLLLRLEYAEEVFTGAEIVRLCHSIASNLHLFGSNVEDSSFDAETKQREVFGEGQYLEAIREVCFGEPLA